MTNAVIYGIGMAVWTKFGGVVLQTLLVGLICFLLENFLTCFQMV